MSDLRFDARLFWWRQRVPESGSLEDICCAFDCRVVIPEEEVPLILWSEDGTEEARVHWACAQRLGLLEQIIS